MTEDRPALGCPDEATVVAFLEGRLDKAALAELDAHLRGCEACSDLVAAVAPVVLAEGSRLAAAGETRTGATVPDSPAVPSGPLPRGATVGRYVILGLVGRGGMGDVYAAYDPQLDRKVALKLLHDTSAADAHARLLREAKAIARLSHPNVVVVHDAGTVDDRVFIAMEFVDGQTLAAWLGGKVRPWRELRPVFLAAGRGLAAAHAAGVIHRDFKPQNVMITGDGTVRVMDFGLAGQTAGEEPQGGAAATAPDHADFTEPGAVALTRTGTLMGTPAYMAPEQFLAERTDARTDQFSFCVSLYEAVYGERPFAGDSMHALADSVTSGRLRKPPQRRNLPPAWLRKVLLRGLRVKREERFPSMAELLAALARDPERQRRRLAIGVGAAALLLAGGGLVERTVGRSGAALCRGAADKLAAIWELPTAGANTGRPRHDMMRAAFVATGVGRAAETADRAAALLDEYARRWAAMYGDACEATHVRGEQSTEVLDLRMTCLDRSRDTLRALTDVLVNADPHVVPQAIDAAGNLPDLARCADVPVLRAVVPPPTDPAARKKVEEIRRRAATIRVQAEAAGRFKEAVAQAEPLLAEARAVGYAPAVAEVLALLAWVHTTLALPAKGGQEYEEALWVAEATRHDEIAAEAAVQLVAITGYMLNRIDDGQRWGRFSDAILQRMGPGHDRLAGWLAHNRGTALFQAGYLKPAEEQLRLAITLKTKAERADSPDLATSIETLAEVRARGGDFAGALAESDNARAIFDRAYGPGGPISARGLNNRCEYLAALGRYEEALASCQSALVGMEAALGRDHPWVAFPLTGMGTALLGLHRPREALAPLRRALDIRGKAEPRPDLRAETRFALARAEWENGIDRAAARAAAEAARAEYATISNTDAKQRVIDEWLSAHPALQTGIRRAASSSDRGPGGALRR